MRADYDEIEELAYHLMAQAHPVETWVDDPERFWRYFHERHPAIPRQKFELMMADAEKELDEYMASV